MDVDEMLNRFCEQFTLIDRFKQKSIEVIRQFNVGVDAHAQEPVIDTVVNTENNNIDDQNIPIADGGDVARENEDARLVNIMMTHGQLTDEETRSLVNVFIRLINRRRPVNMQDINFYFHPENYQPVHEPLDTQIFYSYDRGMDTPNYLFSVYNSTNEPQESVCDPNETAKREEIKLNFFQRYETVTGDPIRLTVLKRLYGETISISQFFVPPKTVGADNGTDCDCNAILCLAYAISYILGRDPETTGFQMSPNDGHGTMFIRMKLFEMFRDQQLYPFIEQL